VERPTFVIRRHCWSARLSRLAGISIPSAFPVLRLITSSKRSGCSIGNAAGLAPLMISSWRCRTAVRCTRADARPRAQNRLPEPRGPRGPILYLGIDRTGLAEARLCRGRNALSSVVRGPNAIAVFGGRTDRPRRRCADCGRPSGGQSKGSGDQDDTDCGNRPRRTRSSSAYRDLSQCIAFGFSASILRPIEAAEFPETRLWSGRHLPSANCGWLSRDKLRTMALRREL